MKRPTVTTLILAAVAALTIFPAAQADQNGSSISVAFARDEPPANPPYVPGGSALAPTDVAGAPGYESANWNNETGGMGTSSSLRRDDNGVASASTASVMWSGAGTWASEGRGPFNNVFDGADQKLYDGYLDGSDLGGGNYATVTISNIDADIAASYSVVVYALGDNPNRNGDYHVNDPMRMRPKYAVPGGPTSYHHLWLGPTYIEIIGDDPTYGVLNDHDFGNYMVFTGMSGTTATIVGVPRDFRAPITAVQIVATP